MKSGQKIVYMDHAAATPLDPRVLKSMEKYLTSEFGNPNSIHSMGIEARRAVENSRKRIADILKCRSSEIVFTSGGTEGDNLAIVGIARKVREKFGKRFNHIIVSAIEHHAILSPCKQLEGEGFEISYLPVSQYGLVSAEELKKIIRPDTFLVSVMYVNNEVGMIQPIIEIAKTIRHVRKMGGENQSLNFPLLHTDACQAPGVLPLNVAKLGVDLMTLSGAKMYGPKGVGCLYIKTSVDITPLIFGGGQERGLRSGTENVAGIVGMAKALEISDSMREKENTRLGKLRNYFAEQITKKITGVEIIGSMENDKRSANNLSIYFPDVENEQLVIELDAIGVKISAGSACDANESTGSHVIKAMFNDAKKNRGTVRFTFGRSTTKSQIDYVVKALPEIVKRIKN